jgi:hypothetical protein
MPSFLHTSQKSLHRRKKEGCCGVVGTDEVVPSRKALPVRASCGQAFFLAQFSHAFSTPLIKGIGT